MIVPRVNVDHFRHRPVRELAALLPDEQAALAACQQVQSAGIDVDQAQILQGSEGARILDQDGREHGYATRLVRALQKIGYDQTFLAVYDEGLRRGEALLSIGCAHDAAFAAAELLEASGGHAMVYFGVGVAETLSSA